MRYIVTPVQHPTERTIAGLLDAKHLKELIWKPRYTAIIDNDVVMATAGTLIHVSFAQGFRITNEWADDPEFNPTLLALCFIDGTVLVGWELRNTELGQAIGIDPEPTGT